MPVLGRRRLHQRVQVVAIHCVQPIEAGEVFVPQLPRPVPAQIEPALLRVPHRPRVSAIASVPAASAARGDDDVDAGFFGRVPQRRLGRR